ncbi:Conserved_hypothetical protein [Hexamita inflata]|uniref:Uncharacterized protein n=1 Tax=Hexamita inflata TaxID=28002 RepID=A0AA86TSR2_9EUKA|nr:Conserved hypothetical protein [Hexamita inflata]
MTFLISSTLQYLMYEKYSSAKELLDRPYNNSQFPSSFYMSTREPHYTMSLPNGPVCFPDLMAEEFMDGLNDEEREIRKKYNFMYTKNGTRTYPMRDGHYKHYRDEHKKDCRWKYYRGKCIIHTLLDDWYHKDHVIVQFEFQPGMAKQVASDLNETLLINFFNPSYEYVMDHNLKAGNVYKCDKRKKLTGDCPNYDYDFIELEDIDEKEAKKK